MPSSFMLFLLFEAADPFCSQEVIKDACPISLYDNKQQFTLSYCHNKGIQYIDFIMYDFTKQ